MKITTPEIQCITYTALISKFGNLPVDSRQRMQFVQIPKPTTNPKPETITPQAFLAGGCDNPRISAIAHTDKFSVALCGTYQRYLPTNGAHWVHHGHLESGFTMGTVELRSGKWG